MKKLRSLVMALIIVSTIFIMPKSNAAGLTIAFSKSTANIGENVTVTVNGNGIAGKISLSVSGNATVTPTSVWVDNSSATATVTINGSGNVKVTATPVDASDSTTANPFTTATAGTISVAAPNSNNNSNQTGNSNSGSTSSSGSTEQPKAKSNIATLSNLGIKGQYDFTGFKSSKTSYSVTVPNEAETVEIYVSKGQSGQKITGTGVKKLNEGSNTVNVVVTAEDGKTTKTYTINIERKTAEVATETPEETTEENSGKTEEQETFGLKELKLGDLELTPEFKTDVYEYSVELKENRDSLDLATVATVENAEIEVSGNENLKDGENIITIIVKEKDTDKTATYQITVNKLSTTNTIVDATVNNVENNDKEKMIVLGVCIAIILLIIIIAVIIVKKRKNTNNEEEYYYSELYNDDEEKEKIEQDNQINEQDEVVYEEEPKKKRHSKGKRFK